MTDVSQGPGWWQASDGLWYPPREADTPPAPGWWLASDGKWYPPSEDETPPAPGWWLASDGKWYPPEDEPTARVDQPVEPAVAPPTSAPAQSPAPAPAHTAAHTGRNPGAVDRVASLTTGGGGTDATEQIRRRNAASREDAMTQFPARFLAASRAVALLESELGATEDEATPRRARPTRSERSAAKAEAAAKPGGGGSGSHAMRSRDLLEPAGSVDDVDPSVAPIEAAAPAGSPAFTPAVTPVVEPAPPEPPPKVPVGRPKARPDEAMGWPAPRPTPVPAARVDGALLELRPSPLGTELDHVGDRLLVFGDHVELRDRSDKVRQVLAGSEITDVIVQRKFTGAVLTIESDVRESIVVKGLKPDAADEVRSLVLARTHGLDATGRPDGSAVPSAGASAGPSAGPAATPSPGFSAPSPDAVANAADRLAILNRNRLNEADLLRKLADLHRAGVLSDSEFEDKIGLVGRLVSGETIAIG